MLPFSLSAVLLVFCSVLIAAQVSPDWEERFWVFIASTALQLGSLSVGTSLFHVLTPSGWLVGQFLLLILLLLVFSRSILVLRPSPKEWLISLREFFFSLPPLVRLALVSIAAFVLASSLEQLITPLWGFDDRMYHASRAIYWLENQSVFPYVTHNDRQVVFTFGSELFFMWPILFARTEWIGRMVFWSGFPAMAIGAYTLMRQLSKSANTSVVGVLVLVATPIVASSAIGLAPEIWLAVMSIGAGFWVAKSCKNSKSFQKDALFAGLFAVLAVNVKMTAFALIVSLLLLVVFSQKRSSTLSFTSIGMLVGLFLSGLIVILWSNQANYGNLLGPDAFRQTHASEISPTQLYVHAVRLPLLLFELPALFPGNLREEVRSIGKQTAHLIRADIYLRAEDDVGFPGHYSFEAPGLADKYSLGGIVWLPLLSFALFLLTRGIVKTFPRIQIDSISAVAILEAAFLFEVVFLLRWMTNSRAPERFLVGPYALGLAISVTLLATLVSQWRLLKVLTIVLIVYMVVASSANELRRVSAEIAQPHTAWAVDAPFAEALALIPPGAHILLFGNQDAADYGLFAPRNSYSNQVISWGQLPIETTRLRALIESDRITDIIVENDRTLQFFGRSVQTGRLVAWLSEQPDIRQVPLPVPGMRLFGVAR